MPSTVKLVQKAFLFALNPTPRQERTFTSHVGGARFAYNWGINRIAQALTAREDEKASGAEPTTPVPDHFDLCKQWTEWKNTAEWTDKATGETTHGVPWVSNNFVGTYQAALRDAARAWANYFDSRTGVRQGGAMGRPRFKSKATATESFQVHGGTLRLAAATKVVLPKIGTVTVMSDDSRHPAMARSRKRGQRHMGNRRRSRHLWECMQRGQHCIDTALGLLHALADGTDPDAALTRLNQLADDRARAKAVEKFTARLQVAKEAEATADTDAKRARATARVAKAADRVAEATTKAKSITAHRKDAWTPRKLREVITTGHLTPIQGADLLAAHDLTDARRAALATILGTDAQPTGDETRDAWRARIDTAAHAALAEAAMQPRIVRGTITRRADGLWWLSLSAEIPVPVRTDATRRQKDRGAVGIDLGVRETATLSKRPGKIRNPRYLERALGELRRAQQHLARCQSDSARRARAKRRVGLIHADVARLRDQHLHRASTRLARRFDRLAVEGFDLRKLTQDGSTDMPRKLREQRNRGLSDTALGKLRTQLDYKTSLNGSHLTVIEQGAPTGRTCAACGQAKAKPVPPWHQQFVCDNPACRHSGPRRLNTARVLEQAAAGSVSPHGGSDQSRGGEVSLPGPRSGEHFPVKRAARARPSGRGKTGTPDP